MDVAREIKLIRDMVAMWDAECRLAVHSIINNDMRQYWQHRLMWAVQRRAAWRANLAMYGEGC